MSISVLIPTRNEQQDLPGCLRSVSWCDDIHVYDSTSSDETVAIAERFGARVTSRGYGDDTRLFGGDESAHRNWGLHNIPFRHAWVFHLDADERMTDELVACARAAVAAAGDRVAFRVRRRDFLLGTWLKHVQASPYYLRLFRPDRMRYERAINPLSIPDGATGDVDGYLDHFPFSKGIDHWIERHNGYSALEARQIVGNRADGTRFSWTQAFVASDFHRRRFHQKELFYRLPMRPLLKFLLLYVGKRGFLDGRAGLRYAVLQSIYEYMIAVKVRELEEADRLAGRPRGGVT